MGVHHDDLVARGELVQHQPLQVAGVNVPSDIIQMLPFVAVMLVLILFGRKASPPAALGLPYMRGQR